MLSQIHELSEILKSTSIISRFNRDVEDALSRIQEKYASIPEDLGRNLKAVQAYLKKHEGFENDLVALEAQVCNVNAICLQRDMWTKTHKHLFESFIEE